MINFFLLSISIENTLSNRSTLPRRNGVLSSWVIAHRTFRLCWSIFKSILVSHVVIKLAPMPSAVLFRQFFLLIPKMSKAELGKVVKSAPVSKINSNSFQPSMVLRERGTIGIKILPRVETKVYLKGNSIRTSYSIARNMANHQLVFFKRFGFSNLLVKLAKFLRVRDYFAGLFRIGDEAGAVFFIESCGKYFIHTERILSKVTTGNK